MSEHESPWLLRRCIGAGARVLPSSVSAAAAAGGETAN